MDLISRHLKPVVTDPSDPLIQATSIFVCGAGVRITGSLADDTDHEITNVHRVQTMLFLALVGVEVPDACPYDLEDAALTEEACMTVAVVLAALHPANVPPLLPFGPLAAALESEPVA